MSQLGELTQKVDAFFARHGIYRVDNMSHLARAAELYLKGWRPRRRNVVPISNSGAVCVMAADIGDRLGLQLPPLAADTQARLAKVLPGFASFKNPIDITAALLSNSGLFGAILPILADDPNVDMLLIAIPVAGEGYDLEAFGRDTAAFAQTTGKVVAVAAPQDIVQAPFRARGIPCFYDEADALAALKQLAAHTELMLRVPAPAPAPLQVTVRSGTSRRSQKVHRRRWR